MDKSDKLIIFGFLVCVLFYAYWYDHNHYIFGKSDVDNYFRMREQNLTGLSIRHVIVQALVKALPMKAFIIIIPVIFWFGIAWPVKELYGSNALFNLIFGTAAVQFFFIVSIWSQFISMSFFLFALLMKRKGHKIWYALLIAASCIYLPTLYFYLSYSFSTFLIVSLFLISFQPSFYSYVRWLPFMPLFLHISPAITYSIFYGKDRKHGIERAKFFVMSLVRSGRAFIYLFMGLDMKLSLYGKIISVIWWIASFYLFLSDFMNEYLYCSIEDGCRILYPHF